jgi:iron(III) transport system permease protein
MSVLHNARSFCRKPHNLILLLLFVVLCYLTLFPLIALAGDTVLVHTAEVRRLKLPAGTVTGDHWYKIFADASVSFNGFYRPLVNSLLTSLGACAIALVSGGLLAWFITRTNMYWKPLISSLCLFPYIMPSWTLALAWYNIFKNSVVGGTPGLVSAILGIETPNWLAYGGFPIALVTGLHYTPFAYIMIGGVLRNMDANLEEAALLLHASRLRIIQKVTLPIVIPAVLSTFLLVFSSAMSNFAVPVFLGLPVRYQVLTTQLYRTLNGLNPGQGYVTALFLILLGLGVLAMNQRIVGVRKNYTTVTGKSSNIALVNLKQFRPAVSLVIAFVLILVSLVPLLSFALESLILHPGNYSPGNFTLSFWVGAAKENILANNEPGLLRNGNIYRVLWNSIKLSVFCALAAGTLGFLTGYAVVRGRGSKLSTAVDNLAFFPYLMPAMAFSAIYLSMFAMRRGPIPALYGTFAILVITGMIKYLPFASRAGINAMFQLSREIEEAGLILGAGWFKRMLRLVVPIQKASFISGYLLPFISCMRELDLFILLMTPKNQTLTTLLFYYNEKGWEQFANGINLLIVLVVIAINLAVTKLSGASIDKGIGG